MTTKILIKVLNDAGKKYSRKNKNRDEQMKCFGTFHEPKMRANIYLIVTLEGENRENNGKEII